MFAAARKLREAGVLGLNERNAEFIMRLNPRRLYPRVDDKALTKQLALEAGMAVPDLYGIIDNQGDVRRFAEIVAEHDSFVVKPAQGSGGDGILVITGRSRRKRDCFRLSSGVLITEAEIAHHLSNIVSGQYSLSGGTDKAVTRVCLTSGSSSTWDTLQWQWSGCRRAPRMARQTCTRVP
jgi:alpha-L-glutamate ligase-like protein